MHTTELQIAKDFQDLAEKIASYTTRTLEKLRPLLQAAEDLAHGKTRGAAEKIVDAAGEAVGEKNAGTTLSEQTRKLPWWQSALNINGLIGEQLLNFGANTLGINQTRGVFGLPSLNFAPNLDLAAPSTMAPIPETVITASPQKSMSPRRTGKSTMQVGDVQIGGGPLSMNAAGSLHSAARYLLDAARKLDQMQNMSETDVAPA